MILQPISLSEPIRRRGPDAAAAAAHRSVATYGETCSSPAGHGLPPSQCPRCPSRCMPAPHSTDTIVALLSGCQPYRPRTKEFPLAVPKTRPYNHFMNGPSCAFFPISYQQVKRCRACNAATVKELMRRFIAGRAAGSSLSRSWPRAGRAANPGGPQQARVDAFPLLGKVVDRRPTLHK